MGGYPDLCNHLLTFMSTRYEVICWYTPEVWAKVRALSRDGEALGSTYDRWLEGAQSMAQRLEAEGAAVARVHVDAGSLLAFARSTHADNIDSGVRQAFAL